MDDDELRAQAAANVAAWHESSVRALHGATARSDAWWSYPAPAPNIYFTAISLAKQQADRHDAITDAITDDWPDDARAFVRAHLDDPAGGHVCLCDSWDELDLVPLGLERKTRGRWCVRPATPLPLASEPEGLEIEAVRDTRALAVFERTMVTGFGARLPVAPFDIHAPGILDDPAMHVFLGRHGGRPVAVSMAYLTDEMLGVYGVATIAGARGRGFATAMTRAALAVDPTRTAMLQPSVEAWPIYEALGFVDIGSFSHWG